MKLLRGLAALTVISLAFGACGSGEQTGSKKVLDFQEQSKGGRLGDATPTPAPGRSAAPVAKATPAPAVRTAVPAARFVDVSLVAGNPYYSPSDKIQVPAGATLRVTNNDRTPERSQGRTFTAENRSFDSGVIKPGATWTHTFTQKGSFTVIDKALNFARATLQVY